MKTTELLLYFLLAIAPAAGLYLNTPSELQLPSSHQSQVGSSPGNYLDFLRFMHNINSLNNNAGFIRRTLILNYPNQYLPLQTAFNEVYVGIGAIKQSLINNHLLVNSIKPICPTPGTFNQS